MSMPNIPDITPDIDIDREKSIDLLIASVALEQLGLAHIINAEAEKIQSVLGTLGKHDSKEPPAADELLEINKAVEKMLKKVIEKEILLDFLLENAIDLTKISKEHDDGEKEKY